METAFNRIIAQCKDTMRRICRSYADSPDDVDDMFQEICLQIWRSLPNFRQQADVRTWVYRISLNVCMRWKFRLEKERKHMAVYNGWQLPELTDADHAAKQQQIEALHACIRKLPEPDRAIIILFLEDLSYKQISVIAGITENHVAVKIKRIKSKLSACINQ